MKTIKQFTRLFLLVVFIFSISNTYSQTCPDNILAYWRLEEIGDTVLSDFIGSNDATGSLLTNVSGGIVGNAKYLDGSQAVTVPDNSIFDFPLNSSFSVELWIKLDDATWSGTYQVIIGKGTTGTPNYWFIALNNTGNLVFEVQSNGHAEEIVSASNVATNTWRHIVGVRNEATNQNILYIDGSSAGNVTYNYTGSFATDDAIKIGRFANSSGIPAYWYRGNIDEIAIYNRALSSSEISTHHTSGISGMGYCDGPAPSIISVPNTHATVGSAYTYDVFATGQQALMKYYLVTNPTGMSIDLNTGLISWIPTSVSQNGLVKVRADNLIAPADTQTFRIFIASAPVIPTNLSVLLKLDESAGPVYDDRIGSHDATASVSPVATTGIVNGAQTFSSSTEVDIPDINGTEFDWTATNNFSLECWMKTSTTATMVCLARHRRFDDFPDRATWYVGTNSSGEATFFLQDNNTTPKNFEISGGPVLSSDNDWHHIIAVREGSIQENRLYVDGVEVANIATNYGNSFGADSLTDISLGYYKYTSGYHFLGQIDEVAIWNKAISDAEAVEYYNGGNPEGHCAPGNYMPVITSTPSTAASEGIEYIYNITVDDGDPSDYLTISVPVKPTWLNLTWTPGSKNAVLSGTPGETNIGPANVTVQLYDGEATVTQPYIINVVNINDVPIITSTPQTTAFEDIAYTYVLTVTDDDVADVISMAVVSKPSWLGYTYTAGAKTATLSGTPIEGEVGGVVDISIFDGTVTIHENYTLTVDAENDPPVISGQVSLSVDEDNDIVLSLSDLTVTDPDHTPEFLTLNVYSGSNYTFSGTTITPNANYNGPLSVDVSVSDPFVESNIFPLAITVNSVNDPPEIVSDPDLEATVDHQYVYILIATDVEGDNLTMSAPVLPDWLDFYPDNGALIGTPTSSELGEQLVTLRVSDGTDHTDETFIITVNPSSGVSDINKSNILIFPVPATDVVNFIFEEAFAEDIEMRVYNNSGAVLKSETIVANTAQYKLNISDLDPNIYFVSFTNSKVVIVNKIVISE